MSIFFNMNVRIDRMNQNFDDRAGGAGKDNVRNHQKYQFLECALLRDKPSCSGPFSSNRSAPRSIRSSKLFSAGNPA
jgi:hypothetical protein